MKNAWFFLVLFMFLVSACTKEQSTTTTQTTAVASDTSLNVSDYTNDSITDTIPKDYINPTKTLTRNVHKHVNVPSIAEKAHQNPVKVGRMQSRIRRGAPLKARAMRSSNKKKKEFMEARAKK